MYLMAACMPSFPSLKRRVPGLRDISISKIISEIASRPTIDSFKRVWMRKRDTSEGTGDEEMKIIVHTVHTVSSAKMSGK